jgi:hypothetical protein
MHAKIARRQPDVDNDAAVPDGLHARLGCAGLKIWKPGLGFQKCGIMLTNLVVADRTKRDPV